MPNATGKWFGPCGKDCSCSPPVGCITTVPYAYDFATTGDNQTCWHQFLYLIDVIAGQIAPTGMGANARGERLQPIQNGFTTPVTGSIYEFTATVDLDSAAGQKNSYDLGFYVGEILTTPQTNFLKPQLLSAAFWDVVRIQWEPSGIWRLRRGVSQFANVTANDPGTNIVTSRFIVTDAVAGDIDAFVLFNGTIISSFNFSASGLVMENDGGTFLFRNVNGNYLEAAPVTDVTYETTLLPDL